MNVPRIIFFGTPDESVIVLKKITEAGYPVVAVVTKPASLVGRKQMLTPSPVAVWAQKNHIPVLTFPAKKHKSWLFDDETGANTAVLNFDPDVLISADFTLKIPMSLVKQMRHGGLNIHPSLLPAYRGPAPIPWQILNGETHTGVSIVTLSEDFDAGRIVAQEKEVIQPSDMTPDLLPRLFGKGADLFIRTLPGYLENLRLSTDTQNLSPSYFPRLTRSDGFVPMDLLNRAIEGFTVTHTTLEQLKNETIVKAALGQKREVYEPAIMIDRAFRALHPWPGIWTKVTINDQEKRLKLLKLHLEKKKLYLDEVQLEGKVPISGYELKGFMQRYVQPQPASE